MQIIQPGANGAGPAHLFVRGRAESRRVWLASVKARLLVQLPLIFPAVPTSKAVGRLRYRFGYNGFCEGSVATDGMASAPASLRAVRCFRRGFGCGLFLAAAKRRARATSERRNEPVKGADEASLRACSATGGEVN